MKGKMNGNKLRGVLLIAVFLLTTLSGIAFIPIVSAATSVTVDVVFESDGGSSYGRWAASPPSGFGAYAAEISTSWANQEWAHVRIYPELTTPVTLATILTNLPSFSYYLAADGSPQNPDIEMTFYMPSYDPTVDKGWVDISVFPRTPATTWSSTAGGWREAVVSSDQFATAYGMDAEGNAINIQTGTSPLTTLVAAVIADPDVANTWTLGRVSPQVGYASGGDYSIAYIDNVTVGDTTYDLEPQTLTAGTAYDIAWTTNQLSTATTLTYTPEDEAHLSESENTNPTGVVNYYSVTPLYAGNWTLSDLITVPTPVTFTSSGTSSWANWSVALDSTYGDYNAKLITSWANQEYALVRVYPESGTPITLDTIIANLPSFKYWLTSAGTPHNPDIEMTFYAPDYESTVDAGWVDISVFPRAPATTWASTTDSWLTAQVSSDQFATAWGMDSGGSQISIQTGTNPLSTLVTAIIALGDVYGNWTLGRVSPQVGFANGGATSTVYIDNVVVGGVTYDLEPQHMEDGLIKLEINLGSNHWINTYFQVQPAKDLTVAVSPTALDTDDGTTALTVTVTNSSGAVSGAYVNVEFWENTATHSDTNKTTLLRSYSTQTASNGQAMFDIEVPEVAGTIHVTAGVDDGPLSGDPDGNFYEHWGETSVTISPLAALAITASPLTYTRGIEWDLNVTLANSPSTLDVIGAATQTGFINITITGDDLSVAEIGPEAGEASLALLDTESKLDVINVYIDGVDRTTVMFDADITTGFTGDVIVIRVRSDAHTTPAQIQLYDFKSTTVVDVTISADVDLGGVAGTVIDGIVAGDGVLDILADYVDTGDATIDIIAPSDVNLQGLVPSTIAAIATTTSVSFTVYYVDDNGDVQIADTSPEFTVVVTYPTGRTYTDTIDGTGIFQMDLDDTTDTGDYYKADEAGNFTIAVSGYRTGTTSPISGSATIPVTGYLVSSDTETVVVLENSTIAITVTNSTGSTLNNAIVTLTADAGTLTATETVGSAVKINGTVTSISNGVYTFHDVNASQVSTITATVQSGIGTNMARLEIAASNPVLTITSTNNTLTNLIDNVFTVRVMNGATAESGATVALNSSITFTAVPSNKKTNSTGHLVITIDKAQLPSTVEAARVYVVSSDSSETGELILHVAVPVYVANATQYLTAGLDSVGNFTLKSAGTAPGIILADDGVTTGDGTVHANLHLPSTDTGGSLAADANLEVDSNGYAWFTLDIANSTVGSTGVKEDYLNITAEDTATGALSALVYSIPIYNPIVSNSSYTGFPITYGAYLGQSQNFYFKIEDASGTAVEGAAVSIDVTDPDPAGNTDAAGETTITWEPESTGTFNILLNADLIIGNITVSAYVEPQLVIASSPATVYLDDTVTVTVTADSTAVGFASVDIVDPNGVLLTRMTTSSGTSTFTASILGTWSISVTKTSYTSASTTIEVQERTPTETPAETTGEETLDPDGVPKTSFELGESVLASAEVENVGTESQEMLIVFTLTDPDHHVLPPNYATITLPPGLSLAPKLNFLIPTTGYTTGTWTMRVMVIDDWPAQGGAMLGEPVTFTFTVD